MIKFFVALFYFIKSLRPRHWTKNLFIFAGIIFSKNLLNTDYFLKVIFAFFIFSIISGCGYLINDLKDMERDILHPKKSKRPIPSGKLKKSTAIVLVSIFLPFFLFLAFSLGKKFFLASFLYILLDLIYSFYLKSIIILDVLSISFFFLLRVLAGTWIINVETSPWLLICTILVSLFLGLGKRRYEILTLEKAAEHRLSLKVYTQPFLDQMIAIATSSTLIAYIIYTLSEDTTKKFGTKNLFITLPFVMYGIFRYLYLIYSKNLGGNPEEALLSDIPFFLSILLWGIAVILVIYGGRLQCLRLLF
ncbi:MAG: decaprenyl-phosphate phosphoribosyltransferase [Candidatus Aminicenantia bacterium]